MTDYFAASAASLLLFAAAGAAETTKPKATLSGAPAGTNAVAVQKYVQAPSGSSLVFGFDQAGAKAQGSFGKFSTRLSYDEKNLAASKLDVKVTVGSLDTKDGDRDDTLKGADLFDAARFPTATYSASSFVKSAAGVEAVGKLTIRGVTKDLRLPLTIKTTAAGVELSGDVTIQRLDFGLGQGDWKSTSSVADAVKITYQVALTKG